MPPTFFSRGLEENLSLSSSPEYFLGTNAKNDRSGVEMFAKAVTSYISDQKSEQ